MRENGIHKKLAVYYPIDCHCRDETCSFELDHSREVNRQQMKKTLQASGFNSGDDFDFTTRIGVTGAER